MLSQALNIPNALTILRIILVPLLAFLLIHEEYRAAIWVLLVAGLSDALDGAIAKRFNLMTELGSLLDPLADKALVVTSILALAWKGLLAWWLTEVIIARDLVILGGAVAYYLRAGRLEMAPTIPSKVNTCIQVCLIFVIILTAAGMAPTTGWLLRVIMGCTLVTTVFSGVHYVTVWGRKAAQLKKDEL